MAVFHQTVPKIAGKFRRYLGAVEKLMGLLMVGFAILLITNSINGIANWMIETFPVFKHLGGLRYALFIHTTDGSVFGKHGCGRDCWG